MVDDNKEINISYETLFELLMREKNRDPIQKLGKTFYSDVADYIASKKQLLKSRKQDLATFSESDAMKIEVMIANVNKIVRELYEKREKKIVNMAISRCMTGSDMGDVSNLIADEARMYKDFVSLLLRFREEILARVISQDLGAAAKTILQQCKAGQEPVLPVQRAGGAGAAGTKEPIKSTIDTINTELPMKSTIEPIKSNIEKPGQDGKEEDSLGDSREDSGEDSGVDSAAAVKYEAGAPVIPKENAPQPKDSSDDVSSAKHGALNSELIVRFIVPVPRFIARDMQEYGPYEADEIATLPAEIANILITKKRVEEINSI